MKIYAFAFFISTMSPIVVNVSKAFCIRPAAISFSTMITTTTTRRTLFTTNTVNKTTRTSKNRHTLPTASSLTTATTRVFMTMGQTSSSSSSSPSSSSSSSSSLPEYGNPTYGLTKKLPPGITFPDAITKVTEALKQNGFGVLTEIDMRATMQKKLNVDLGRPYTILGACNPKLALNALQNAPAVGLFLPCNVAVLEDPDGTMVVSIVSPEEMFSIAAKDGNVSAAVGSSSSGQSASAADTRSNGPSGGGVEALAKEVQEIMTKVIDSL